MEMDWVICEARRLRLRRRVEDEDEDVDFFFFRPNVHFVRVGQGAASACRAAPLRRDVLSRCSLLRTSYEIRFQTAWTKLRRVVDEAFQPIGKARTARLYHGVPFPPFNGRSCTYTFGYCSAGRITTRLTIRPVGRFSNFVPAAIRR